MECGWHGATVQPNETSRRHECGHAAIVCQTRSCGVCILRRVLAIQSRRAHPSLRASSRLWLIGSQLSCAVASQSRWCREFCSLVDRGEVPVEALSAVPVRSSGGGDKPPQPRHDMTRTWQTCGEWRVATKPRPQREQTWWRSAPEGHNRRAQSWRVDGASCAALRGPQTHLHSPGMEIAAVRTSREA